MTIHRYTQIIAPIDKYVRRLTPRKQAWAGVVEASLLLALFTSMLFYVS